MKERKYANPLIMTKAVIDTSVVIKWFFKKNEPDSNKAFSLLNEIEEGKIKIVASPIILLELINVVKFGKKADEKTCIDISSLFENLIEEFADFPKTNFIIKTCYAENLTSYDAAIFALAEEKGVPLITADYKHHQKTISPNIIWLSEWNNS